MKENSTKQYPFYSVEIPFEVVYRNEITKSIVLPHTHNALEIYFTLSDLPDVLLNNKVSKVSRNSLIIIPQNHVHQLFNQKLKVYERYIITINTLWLKKVFSYSLNIMDYAISANHPIIIPLTEHKSTILKTTLEVNYTLFTYKSLFGYTIFFSLLEILDSIIKDSLQKNKSSQRLITPSQKKINQIIEFINENISEPITVQQIADEIHLNKDYMARLFKEHTHSTLGHYIAVQKTSLAQTMLLQGNTVTQVQEKLGFSSYAYFHKFFKKMTGLSPSQYRLQNISPQQ